MKTENSKNKNTETKKESFFIRMFMDNNDINEKSIVGFASFIMMVITLSVDIYTGVKGNEMPIHEFIFDGFLILTLGSFGIASIDKYVSSKRKNNDQESDI